MESERLYTKPHRHHYETSKKAKVFSFIYAALIFGLLMFYFVALRKLPFDLEFTNRAFAISAVFLIGFSYLLGPLAGFLPKLFVQRLEYRKPLGLYGYGFAIIHILLSLLIVPGSELAGNNWSLFFGMIAILIFTLVASTSITRIEAHGFERWQRIQRMGYLAFVLVILHFSLLGKGQFIGRQLGQITLGFALLVILARILVLFGRRRHRS